MQRCFTYAVSAINALTPLSSTAREREEDSISSKRTDDVPVLGTKESCSAPRGRGSDAEGFFVLS